jgi:aryl-alcohol dehydrogenase-like predicted oxidoreductase
VRPVETVPLGRLGVSRVGLGCNNFGGRLDLAATRAVVDAALDEGVTFLDTADIYGGGGGSERFLGEILEGRRDRVVLATKFGMDMGDGAVARGDPAYVRSAVEASLTRLRTDHVDLLYYHRPDGVTPLAETLGAMDELVRDGTTREIGCSNLTLAQLDEAARVVADDGLTPLAALQNEYSLLRREAEDDVLPRCRELGIAFVPYFPLASGLLSGKYRRGEPAPDGTRLAGRRDALSDERLAAVERLEAFARERSRTLLELAIGGLASRPGVSSVIAGATSADQVRANAAAGTSQLDTEELSALDELTRSL